MSSLAETNQTSPIRLIGPPRLYVDFNEMVAPDLVLLSQTDSKEDSNGNPISLVEGVEVKVFSDDEDAE